MNWMRFQTLLLLFSPCMGIEPNLPVPSKQPRILLPLDLDKAPPAKVLLDELIYYIQNDKDGNYRSNARAIKHHLEVLQQHYPTQAEQFINQMPIWTHSEHFLERLPRFFLDTLVEMNWHVHPDALRIALNKLGSLLPQDPLDMIDCAAGKPMGQIVRLLTIQQASGLKEIAEQYSHSQDQDLSYAAQCALLSLAGLPEPTVSALVSNYWGINNRFDLQALPVEQRNMAILITVNEGAMKGAFEDWVNAQTILQAMEYLKELHLPDYAQALQCFIVRNPTTQQEELVTGDELHMASIEYSCLAQPAPRNIIAARLLKLCPCIKS
ncbi:MAG: hypothetical protein R3Y56_03235 [Akkermansia sp.]